MPAKIYNLQEYRMQKAEPIADVIDDTQNNMLWDRFAQLASEAWHWRDRESVEELKELLSQIEPACEVRPPAGSTVQQ
jgi:hypothetical protein